MKPSDRIWELANERCVRQGISPTEVGLQDVGTYLDEQRELVIITAPEHASEAEIGKMAEAVEHLIERHDIVIVPFGARVTKNGQVVHGMPQRSALVAAEPCPPRRGKHGDPWKFHHPACKKPDAHEGTCMDPPPVARVGDDVRGDLMARPHAPFGFIAVPFTPRVTDHRFEVGPARQPAVVRSEGELRAAYDPTEETDEP